MRSVVKSDHLVRLKPDTTTENNRSSPSIHTTLTITRQRGIPWRGTDLLSSRARHITTHDTSLHRERDTLHSVQWKRSSTKLENAAGGAHARRDQKIHRAIVLRESELYYSNSTVHVCPTQGSNQNGVQLARSLTVRNLHGGRRMSRIFLASTLATLLGASLAAQAPQNPPSAADPQATAGQSSRSSAMGNTVTVEGCIQKGAASPAGTTGTTGSSASAFMLTSATKPATSKETTPIASSYKLDADDSKLSPHVGHKVEISGTVAQASASPSGAPAAPTLKVDNVKMIAATCTP
jgi:hypothetical protein